MNIRITDPDNRDDRGASFELAGPVDLAIAYLDGPVRRDTNPRAHGHIDEAIKALRDGSLAVAAFMAQSVGVYLTEVRGELPVVVELGEECDEWFVSGTSDAHSAEEAVRKFWDETFGPEEVAEMFGDVLLGSLGLTYRADWGWKHPEGWAPDRAPEDDSALVFGEQDPRMPRFAGFLVQL